MFQRISRQIRQLQPREPVRPAVYAQRWALLDTTVYIDGMHGIGDNINQRCFVKTLALQGKTVFIKTPLPEIYHDIPGVRFVRADTTLRTHLSPRPGGPRSKRFSMATAIYGRPLSEGMLEA